METVIVNGIRVTFGGDRAQTVQRMVEFLDMAGRTVEEVPGEPQKTDNIVKK